MKHADTRDRRLTHAHRHPEHTQHISRDIKKPIGGSRLNLRVVSVYRHDQRVNPRFDPANYTSIPVDGCVGDPVFGWNGEFDR
ncbi:hypothetical protein LK459_08820 [Gordonia otitidis]|uniref:hypothetical protein n=1 Tax=Gordonia otitidis TaxID=249058 RepID=UPI001D15BFE3|nr:hypothetical protein [Gordonia otitidis]UEA57991.1 hypothetical protein LK459_15470 [Gordonia otitidis]UEA60905.1 hypothetical protein LK459_08820 [Gordonia otitidis]